MAPSALQLRLEAEAAYEAYLLDEFRHYPDPIELYRHHFRNTPFVDLHKRRRVLLRPEYWPMLHAAAAQRRHFIRDPMQWKARGHSVPALLWSLVNHLYCRYAMPYYWLAEWMRDQDDVSMSRLQSFALIAQGRSVYTLSRQGMLGLHLSRKECHALGRVHGVWGLGPACRMAQVLARGGTRRLGLALGDCSWGEWPGTPQRELRRGHAITWLCQQPELPRRDLEFVTRAVDAFPNLTFAGRTIGTVREWVGDRRFPRRPRAGGAQARGRHASPPPPVRWRPSHYEPMQFARGRTSGALIRELTSTTALHQEGARLTHCVASYAASAARGECSLWSLRVAGMSLLTIEVRNGSVCQVRGKCNRPPTLTELRLVERWAKHNGLRVYDS